MDVLRRGISGTGFADCSTTELIRVAADAGIEPASIDPRRNPFPRHRRSYNLQSPGITRPGLASDGPVSSVRIGDSLSPCRGRWKYPEPSPPEMYAAPGKDRARLNAVFSRRKTACGVEPPFTRSIRALRHWSISIHSTGERSRCGLGRVKTKKPHPSPPVAVNGTLFSEGCRIQQRVDALTIQRRPTEASSYRAHDPALAASGDRIGFSWS